LQLIIKKWVSLINPVPVHVGEEVQEQGLARKPSNREPESRHVSKNHQVLHQIAKGHSTVLLHLNAAVGPSKRMAIAKNVHFRGHPDLRRANSDPEAKETEKNVHIKNAAIQAIVKNVHIRKEAIPVMVKNVRNKNAVIQAIAKNVHIRKEAIQVMVQNVHTKNAANQAIVKNVHIRKEVIPVMEQNVRIRKDRILVTVKSVRIKKERKRLQRGHFKKEVIQERKDQDHSLREAEAMIAPLIKKVPEKDFMFVRNLNQGTILNPKAVTEKAMEKELHPG